MKTKAILFASVLLVGCQMTPNEQTPVPSSANQDIETTTWESAYLIENDLWGYMFGPGSSYRPSSHSPVHGKMATEGHS